MRSLNVSNSFTCVDEFDKSINLFSKWSFNKFYLLKQKQFHFYKGNKNDETQKKN